MGKQEKDEEVKLLELIKAGDWEAMKEFHKLFMKQVFNSAYAVVGNEQDALDVRQKVFIKVWDRRKTIQMTNPRTYLSKSARNMAINFVKEQKKIRRKHLRASFHQDATQAPHEFEKHDPAGKLSWDERLLEAVKKMPKKQGHIFTEVKIKMRKRKAVAASEKLTIATVDSHLRGAVAFLKKYFKK